MLGFTLLKDDISLIAENAEQYDFVCVNNFVTSPYYEKLKPNLYVFLDGYFFSKEVHDDWVKQRELTFKAINKKTTWKMQIILPFYADEKVLSHFICSDFIEIVKVKNIGVFIKKLNFFTKLYMNSGMFGPAQNNVLIYAIYYCIWAGYKDINIYGSDMTIYQNIHVGCDNELIIKYTHFNDSDHSEKLRTGTQKEKIPTMHEMMFSAYRIFLQHKILNDYAASKSIKIFNKSSISQIDAYSRNFKGDDV